MIDQAVRGLVVLFYLTTGLLAIALVVEVGTWVISAKDETLSTTQIFESVFHTGILVALGTLMLLFFRPAIRKLKSIHQSIVKREAQLSRILSTAIEGYAVIDPKTLVYREVNDALCNMLGYTADEMLGKSPTDFCDPEGAKAFRAQTSTIGDTASRQYQVVMRHKNGRQVHTHYSASTVLRDDGTPEIAFAFITDISNLKRSEEALRSAKSNAEAATALKDKFVSLIAHDLRSPIGAIRGYTEFMMVDPRHPPNEHHKESLTYIFNQTNDLLELISDLLDLTRLQTGAVKLESKFFDAHFMVENLVNRLLLQAEAKDIRLVNEVPLRTRLYADEVLYGQVLQNLISNAIKFSNNRTQVRIFVSDGEQTTLAVQDNGIGVPTALIDKLFLMEEKTSTAGTAGEAGTGLGLPLSRQIMLAHKGDILVESEEGKGSTFRTPLPTVQPKVLLVDDSADIRMYVRAMLDSEGAKVTEAANGREALEHIDKNGQPHLIITDIDMPEMDGVELLKKLKTTMGDDLVPVMVLTGMEDESLRDQCLGIGAADFSRKPIAPEDFMPRVRHFIG